MENPLGCLALTLLLLTSCSPGGGEPEPPPPDAEVRAARAEQLWRQSVGAPLLEKIPLLERLIGTYPDSPRIVEANMALVQYLLDPSTGSPERAERALSVFAERHPAEPGVSECFSWLARTHEGRGEEGASDLERVVARWAAFLEGARSLAAGPDDLAFLYLESAHVCGWRGEPRAAIPWLEKAIAQPWSDLRARQRAVLHLARFLKDEDPERALRLYGEAMDLADRGARGASRESIQAEADGL